MLNDLTLPILDVFHIPARGVVLALEVNTVSIQLKQGQTITLQFLDGSKEQAQVLSVMVKAMVAVMVDEKWEGRVPRGTKVLLHNEVSV